MRVLALILLCLVFATATRAEAHHSHYALHHHVQQQHWPVADPELARPAYAVRDLAWGLTDRGVKEGSNIIAEASRYVGSGKFTQLPGAWCRDALNVWLRHSGLYTDGRRDAPSVGRLGHPTRPVPGAIAYNRSHAGVVVGVSGGKVFLVSGNWSHRVKRHVASAGSYHYVMPHRA
jgi:hypothetical protein